MANLPLTIGDFALAYSVARERWIRIGRPIPDDYSYGGVKASKECVERGLAELRKLRGLDRLPRGATELRARILTAFTANKAREKRKAKWAKKDTGYRWPWERGDRRWHDALVYQLRKRIPFEVELRLQDDPPEVALRGREIRIAAPASTILNVLRHGLFVIGDHVVVAATQVDQFALPLGVRAVFDVRYAALQEGQSRYSWYEAEILDGIVAVPEDGPPHFIHSRETAIYGALVALGNPRAFAKARRK